MTLGEEIMISLCNIKLDTFATVLNLHLHVSEQNTMEMYKIHYNQYLKNRKYIIYKLIWHNWIFWAIINLLGTSLH